MTIYFPVQRSILLTEALETQVLTNYNFEEPVTCRLLHRGMNDTYLVKGATFKCILRISKAEWHTYEQALAEIELINLLAEHNIPVAKPILRKDGTYLQTLNAPEGTRYAVAFTHTNGSVPNEFGKEHAYACGEALAKIHSLTDQHPVQYDRYEIGLDYLLNNALLDAKDNPFFGHHQDDLAYLADMKQRLTKVINQLPRTAPAYGVCHGDFHHANIHFNQQNEWVIFDFDYFGYGWRVYDISSFLWRLNFPASITNYDTLKEAILTAYQTIRPLTDLEIEALPAFLVLHHIWAAGLGAKLVYPDGIMPYNEGDFSYYMMFIKNWIAQNWPG